MGRFRLRRLLYLFSVLSLLGVCVTVYVMTWEVKPSKPSSLQTSPLFTPFQSAVLELSRRWINLLTVKKFNREWVNPSPEFIEPVPETEKFVLILIISAPSNLEQRYAIRQTWLSVFINYSVAQDHSNVRILKDPFNSTNNLLIQYFFVCGHSHEQEVETVVKSESMIHGDILRLNFTESYSLLVQKTLNSLRFASAVNVKFVVKVDDDVYLDVRRMVWRLQTTSLPDMLFGGTLLYNSPAIRDPGHKYFISYEDFNGTSYPVYPNGPFYIMSKKVVLEFLNASKNIRSFKMEDAYLGVLAKHLGIVPTQLDGEGTLIRLWLPRLERTWDDAALNVTFAVGDSLSPERLFAFHERYLKLETGFN